MKFLFGIPSPFDFKLVEKYQKNLLVDRIIPRYYEEVEAYKIIRDYFLRNEEYTHLLIACSDIVVSQGHIELLNDNLSHTDYPVLTGMMNIALEWFDTMNLTKNVVHPQHTEFDWYSRNEMKSITRVGFSGFPLMCIRRDIVERFEFEGLSSFTKNTGIPNGSLDVVLCWKLYQNKIPIYADPRINLLHLKEMQEFSQPTLVGQVKPRTEFIIP